MSNHTINRLFPSAILISTILWSGLLSNKVQAGPLPPGSLQFTASGTNGSDGAVAATVLFVPIAGGIEITLTNTESGTLDKGQAISALSFSVGGGLSTPTAFYKLTGSKVNSASFTPGSAFPGSATVTSIANTSSKAGAGAIDHWGFDPSGSNVVLATAGSSVSGATGHPHYMILPSTGTTGSGKSLADGHFDPYLLGAANFFLTVPGVTATTDLSLTNVTGVQVGFGTGPDVTIASGPGTQGPPHGNGPPVGAAPAPPSVVLFGIGGIALAGIMVRSRRRLLVAA